MNFIPHAHKCKLLPMVNFSKASAYKIMNFDPSKYFQKMNMNNNDIQTKCTVM